MFFMHRTFFYDISLMLHFNRYLFLLLTILISQQFVIAQRLLLHPVGRDLTEGLPSTERLMVNDTTSYVKLEGIIHIDDYKSIYPDIVGEKYSFSIKKWAVIKTRYYYIFNGYLYGNTPKERRRMKTDYRIFYNSHFFRWLLERPSNEFSSAKVIPRKEAFVRYGILIEPDAPGIIVVTTY